MFSLPLNIQSSIHINKPAGEIFKIVSDFSTWKSWSPWLCQEQECEYKISNSPATLGHSQSWNGERIGSGSMQLTYLKENKELRYNLEFLKPWKSKSLVTFTFENSNNGTKLTWGMKGSIPIFLFFMKKMMIAFITNDYKRGLSMLKDLAENGAVESKTTVNHIKEGQAFSYLGLRKKCSIKDIGTSMKDTFQNLMDKELPTPDFSLSFSHDYDMVKETCTYTAAFAYSKRPEKINDDLLSGDISTHRAISVDHHGDYKHLGNGWATAISYLRAKKLKESKEIDKYEIYRNMPGEVPTNELLTEIYIPLK